MTQIYIDGAVVPVTIVEVPENQVCKIGKAAEGEGHQVDIGVGEKKHSNKAESGKYAELKKVPIDVWSFFVSDEEAKDIKVGLAYGSEMCAEGSEATISGISKAKGFAGVIKRWGFHGGPRTHGQSDRERAPGSIGGGTDPGRVYPGKKMPGRMGGQIQTVKNRKIVGTGDGFILIKGSLPGNVGGVLKIEVTKNES